MLGTGDGEVKCVKYLNRNITLNKSGIGYRADDKHAVDIVRELGVEGFR